MLALSEQDAPGTEAGHDRTAEEAGQDGPVHRGIPGLVGRPGLYLGYTPATVVSMLAMAGGLGRWMDAHDLAPADLDRAAITGFRAAMRAAGRRCVPGARGLDPLLDYLEQVGVLVTSPAPATPAEVLVDRYRAWLVADRGLAEATVQRYVKLARTFLTRRVGVMEVEVERLTGADIVAFLLAEGQRLSVGSVKGRVAELRSLLKFLYLQG